MAERTGTLWEHDAPSASCCHGFASHIAHVLYRDVLGVKEIDRVRKTVVLHFADVPLSSCSGEIPIGEDSLKVSWTREGNVVRYGCVAPFGYSVDVTADANLKWEKR